MSSIVRARLHNTQQQVYVSNARFKVVTAGRRWGKCLASDTLVSMADGSKRVIQSLLPGDLVLTINENTYKLEPRPVEKLINNGVRDTITIKTSHGENVATPNHPFLVNNRWVDTADIKSRDLMATVGGLTPIERENGYLPITYDDFVEHLVVNDPAIAIERSQMPHRAFKTIKTWSRAPNFKISQGLFKELREHHDGFFDPLADEDVDWVKVLSVEKSGEVQTWDLSIRGNHNFIANGMVSHNTNLAKTVCIQKAGEKQKAKVWYVAPSYAMAKNIMWDELKESIPYDWVKKINETDLSVKLRNGSLIECKGADNPDSLRGVGLYYVVLDEFQDMKSDTWSRVLRPTLAKDRGDAMFIGTPKGYANLYDLHKLGQGKNRLWQSWQFPTITSPFIPPSEIEAARRDMDPKSFSQEFMASFESMSGRVYYAFDRNVHLGNYPFNPNLPIWIGSDFNIDPMSSAILQPQPNGEVWIVDEISIRNSNTLEVCEEIERRYWRHMTDKSPQIKIYPDPAGGNRQHARGESDMDIYREKGLAYHKYRAKHPPVADRVNAVNKMLMDAAGNVRLRIDSSCKECVKSLDQTLYREGTRDIDKRPGVEHMSDAIGYPIEMEFPSRKIIIAGASL